MNETPRNNSELLRPREAAERLRLSPRTLDRWRISGDGPPFVRLGRRAVAYRVADLEQWITANTSGAA